LAKARVSAGNVKGSSLVAVKHITDQMSDSRHILGQYVSIKDTLLYKTWADMPGVYTHSI